MKRIALVLAAAVFLAGAARASADSVTLKVSASTSPLPGQVKATIGGRAITVGIPPLASATAKRNIIKAALAGAGYTVTDDGPAGSSLTLQGLSVLQPVKFETGNTAESLDTLRHSTCGHGTVSFPGHFGPFNPANQPAIFTAGLVTSVGTLSVQVSAQELNFQTDGPIICQALFQRLAPRAPQYGAQINYSGDRLEVYFDPAYTVTQGGIIFGTTSSQSNGCSGSVEDLHFLPDFKITVDDCTNPIDGFFFAAIHPLTQGAQPPPIQVPVPPFTPATGLRSALLDALHDASIAAFADPDPSTAAVTSIKPRSVVTVSPGNTGQPAVTLSADGLEVARVGFSGFFGPFSYGNQPAIFTAGIVTDVGILREQISAAELNFQTDGPIICQALFQRLAPRAPQYGAQINYAGDRLEVYFDPAYTVTQGGIIFGTTSPSQGCEGTILWMHRK